MGAIGRLESPSENNSFIQLIFTEPENVPDTILRLEGDTEGKKDNRMEHPSGNS